MRRTDMLQLYLVGFALMFLLIVSGTTWAQSQEAINATLFERFNGFEFRLDRLENLNTAALLALIANFVAHIVQIHAQRVARKRREDDE